MNTRRRPEARSSRRGATSALPQSMSLVRCTFSGGGWGGLSVCARQLPVCVVWAHTRGSRGEGGGTCRAMASAEAAPTSLRMHIASGGGTGRRLRPKPVRRRRCRAGRSRRERHNSCSASVVGACPTRQAKRSSYAVEADHAEGLRRQLLEEFHDFSSNLPSWQVQARG
jgi:hypothetical protein